MSGEGHKTRQGGRYTPSWPDYDIAERVFCGEDDQGLPVREFLQLIQEGECETPAPDTVTLDQAITLIRLALAILGVSVPVDQVRRVAARALLDMPR